MLPHQWKTVKNNFSSKARKTVSFDRFMVIKVWKRFSWLSSFQRKQNKVIFMIFWLFLALLKIASFGPISGANLAQIAILPHFWGKTSSSSAKIAKSMLPDCVYLIFPKNSCNLEYFCTFLRFLTPKTDEIQGVKCDVFVTFVVADSSKSILFSPQDS